MAAMQGLGSQKTANYLFLVDKRPHPPDTELILFTLEKCLPLLPNPPSPLLSCPYPLIYVYKKS